MPSLRSGSQRILKELPSSLGVVGSSAGGPCRHRSAAVATATTGAGRAIAWTTVTNRSHIASMSTAAAAAAETNGTNASNPDLHSKPNAWQSPGPAAFDFRSDVVTTPTANMLTAIANTSLLDDVFLEDPTTLALEAHLAHLTGHAAALLVLSGTMGNQLALRTHLTQPPHAVLCDHRAHILTYEAGGVASLTGALVTGLIPANGHHLTLADVRAHAVLSDDVHACPTRVLSLENTLNGTLLPLAEARRITSWARARGLRTHLDGARLWEAVAAGAGALDAYCRAFDSVSLCFSKGLGAPIGSVLVGDPDFVRRARWVRKSIGGGVRQAGVISAAARVAVDDTFGAGVLGAGGKVRASHERARRVADMWTARGGRLSFPVETNMVWLDLAGAGCAVEDFVAVALREGVKVMGGRLVVHYQISEEAVGRLGRVMDGVLRDGGKGEANGVHGTERREAEKVMAPEVDD